MEAGKKPATKNFIDKNMYNKQVIKHLVQLQDFQDRKQSMKQVPDME